MRPAAGHARLARILALTGLLVFLAIALAPHLTASATVRYVDDSYGSDNAGLNQWTTVQRAITNATAGDTIYIYAGTYAENVQVNRTLNIQGESRNSTVIDPVSGSALTVTANNVNLSSFTITGALYGVLFQTPNTNLVIDSLTFEGNTRGVYSNQATNVTISASYFGNHSGSSNAGIYASRGANVTSKNNTFVGNFYGVYFDRVLTGIIRDGNASGNRFAVYLTQTTATAVDRNHIGNSTANGYGIYLDNDHNSTVSSNRIDNITQNGLQLYYSFSLTIVANDISDCGSNLYLYPPTDLSGFYYGHTIATSNLLDGRPAYYFKNTTNVSVPPGAGWVGAFNVTNMTIGALNITNEQYGVFLVRVTNVQLAGINFSNPRLNFAPYAVWAYNITNGLLAGINGTGRFTAAYITNSNGVSVENSTATGNRSFSAYYASLVYANTVTGLRILNNTIVYGQGGSLYYCDFALIQNNSFTDGYAGFVIGYTPYPRVFSNTFNNTTSPFTPYGYDISHFLWSMPANNTWDGRAIRALVNLTNATIATNYAWLLLANVSNLTVTNYSVNNGSGYAGVIAFSNNVTIGNLTQNGSQSGLYIRDSSNVAVWNSITNNSGQPFYISSSSDVTLANGTWQNSPYEGFGVDSSSRVTVRNITFTGVFQSSSYFMEAYSTSDLLLDNVTSTQTYQFAYMETVSFSTLNHINASVGTPFFSGDWALYLYNETDVNFTNSSYTDFLGGLYIDYSNWNLRIVNVTFNGMANDGIRSQDPNSGNFTISQSRFVAPPGGGAQRGVSFENLLVRLTLSGLNISGFGTGIFVDPMTNVTITGSQINNTTIGIDLEYVTNSTVSSNTISDTSGDGIKVVGGSNITISLNAVRNAGSVGIHLDSSTGLQIASNTIQGGWVGLQFYGGRGDLVSGNTVNGTADTGIQVTGGHEASTFNGNTVTNGYVGFFLDGVQFMTLDSNVLSGSQYNFRIYGYWIGYYWHRVNSTNTVDGKPIYFIVNGSGGLIPTTAGLAILANTTSYLVSGLTIGHNWHGILLFDSTGITVLNVTIANVRMGVETENTINSTISNSRIDGGEYGVLMQSATNFSLLRTVINGSNYGFYASSGRSITLTNTTVNASLYSGLQLWYTDASNFTNNTVSNTTYGGVEIAYSSGDVFFSNTITGNHNSFNMFGNTLSYFNHTLPANNTVDGLPVFYRINGSNIVAPSNVSVVVFANITNGTVTGMRLNNTGSGIIAFGSRFLNISNITLANGNAGVRTIQTSNVTLWNFSSDRTAYYSMNYALQAEDGCVNITFVNSSLVQVWQVVYAYYSSNITIRNLTIGDLPNYTSGGAALWANGRVDNVTIDLINFSYASFGVYMYGYSDTEKVSNVTVSNSSFGSYTSYPIYIGSPYAENISFFHNNFDLTYGASGYFFFNDPYNLTVFSRPYPSGGNYWSNWTGPDSYKGASQSTAGGDGIVDLSFDGPYVWDRYPLVDPWPARVALLSPANGSAILPGVILDFRVSLYFDTVKFAIDNGSASAFAAPFDINTTGWTSAVHTVWVNASDATGVADSGYFVFVVDTTAPSIVALSPAPGALYATGTQLNYTITDAHLAPNATLDLGLGQFPFATPWNLSTTGFADGWFNVTVRAWDTAGNGASSTFNYAVDGNTPVLDLNSPSNNSVIPSGTTVDLSITDAFFQNASWSTGSGWTALSAPFDISTTGWADGSTTLVVVAFDQLARQTVRSYVFVLDSTLPTIALNTPSNNSVIQAGTTLDLSVADTNFQNASWSNGSAWNAILTPFDIATAGWADGATSVTVRAFDLAGNSRTSVFTFTFDSTQPTITLVSPASNSVVQAGTTLDFSVADANLGPVTRNNGSGAVVLSSPFDISTTAWADGPTNVTVIATDLAGNSRTRVFAFTFDSTQPTITLNTPSNNSFIQPGTALDFSVSDTNLNTVTRNNGSGAVALGSPFDVATGGWADGPTNVTVVATDLAGNSLTRVFSFTLDSTRPSIVLVSPSNNSVIKAGTTLDFSVTDANAVTATWNNGSGANALVSPFDVATASWPDGSTNVTIVATDAAGNARTSSSTFTFDTTLPSVTLVSPSNNSYIQAGSTLDFAVSDLHLSGATWNNGSGPNTLTSPFDLVTTGWADGPTNVTVVGTDTAGNARSVVFHFTIDSTPPSVALASPSNSTVWNSGVTLDFTVSDTNLNAVTWNNGAANSSLGSPYDISTTGWAEADYVVTVRATDLAGNARLVVVLIGIDNTAPTITLNQPTNGSTFGAGTTIDLSVSDAHAITATRNNGSGNVALAAPYDIDTTGWTNGSYTVGVNATDAAGNVQFRSYSFTIDNAFPAVLLNSPANNSVVLPGTTLDFDIVDSDLNSVTWNDTSGAVAFSPPYDISTAGRSDGHVNITIVASDNSSHVVTVVFHFIFDSIQPTIVLNGPTNASVIQGGTALDFSVSDLNLGAVTWNNGSGALALASPFDVPTGGWSDGSYTVTIVAQDLAGNSRTASYAWTVDSTAPAIAFVSPANNSVDTPGTTLDFSIGDAHSFTATRDNGSGSVTLASPFDISTSGWTDGTFDVAVVATDIAGNSASRSVHITIDSLLPAVSLLSPANGSTIPAGFGLDLDVSDLNFQNASWTNGTGWNALTAPFDISTAGWADGATTVTVAATDLAGNRRNVSFAFTIDSTPPSVSLVAPANNSYQVAGVTLDFAVTDTNLASVTWNNTSGAQTLSSPFDVSTTGWADGPFDVVVVALDLAGNGRTFTAHVVIDSTPPSVSLVAPSNNSVVDPGSTLDFAVSDMNLNTVTRNNGSGALALASPFDLVTSGWADGSTNVTVTATDLAGNTRVVVFRFVFDGTAPTISLVAPSNNSVTRSGTTLDFTVTDANSVASASWDNGSGAVALSAPYDVATTGWLDGSVTVTVTATDGVGNLRVALFAFVVDSTPPTVALVAPSNNSVITPGTTLDFALVDTNGVASATRNNGSGNVALPSPYDVSTTAWLDGAFDVVVNATDVAGNVRSGLFHFTLDGSAPTVLLVSPSNNSVIAPGALLDFSVSDANLAGASWNNGTGPVLLPSPFDVSTVGWPENSGASTTNVTLVATDLAGNTFTFVARFTFDATAPSITLVSPANNSVIAAGVTIDLSVTDAHLSSASWNNGSGVNALASPFDISTAAWANGNFNVTVTATDQAGNTWVDTFRFVVDSTGPNITLNAPANNSVIAGGTLLDISVVDPNLNNASWTNGSLWNALASPFDIPSTGWLDGLHTVTVSATDLAGNTRTASFRFTFDSTPPSLTLSSPANASILAPGTTIDFDAADANLANVSWNNGSGPNALPDPFDLSTAGWPEGNRNITVVALDLAGNTRTLVFFFTFDATPPTITLVTPANNTIITAGTVIDLTVSDLHLDTATWDNSSGTNNLPSPYNISTAGWADGAYNVTVVATDLAGNTRTVGLHYTFDTTPPTVTLLSPSNNSFVRAGTTLDLLITDLTTLTVTWDNGSGPNTLASPYDINTAGWGDGAVDLAVLASDAVGNARTRVFHFTFDTTLPAITLLTPTNNSVIRQGVAVNFSISDTNLNTATWDNGGGVTGFATQWSVPTTGWSDGPYNISIDAADLAGNVRTRTFHFTIDTVLPAITLNSPSNNSYIAAGTLLNLTISDLNLASATWDDGTGAQTLSAPWAISTAGWSDGPTNITVYAVDGATNSRTRTFHFTIDSTVPALSLLSPTNNSYLVAGVLINFTLSDANLNTATWDNGGGAQSFSTQWNVSTAGWADGPYNITVAVTDLAGNLRTRVFHFTVDSTQPSISLTSPSNDSYVDAGTVITLAIADTNLNVVTWDSGSGPQSFAAQWTIATATLPDASYNFTVVATDLAGNLRTRVYHIWIDSTVPTIALNGATPANGSTFDAGATLVFDVVEAHVGSATWNNGTSGTVAFGAPFQVSTAGWQDGVFDLAVRVTDRAGHQAYFVDHFTLDSVAPAIANVSWEGGYFPAGWRLNGTYNDSNLLWWNFQVDAVAALNGTSSGYQVDTTGLVDGAHSIRVQVGDRAGHVSTRVFPVTIDSDPPVIQNILPADGSFFRPGVPITFTVLDNNTANVTWRRNAGAILPANGTGGPRNINTITWTDGNWTVQIFASDLAGHVTSVSLTLVTDSAPPSMPSSLSANQTYDEDGDTLLDATSAADAGNPLPDASFVWVFTDRLGPLALGPLTGRQVTYSGWTQPGDFEYTLNITDLAGNSANRTYGVHILDLTPPEIRLSVPASADEDTPVLLDGSQTTDNDPTFLASDSSCAGGRFALRAPDGSVVTLTLVGVGGPNPTACLAPSHTFAEPGVYSIGFNVTDKSGNGNSTVRVIRVLDKTAPDVGGFSLPAVVNEGANVTLDATATTDNDAANVSLIGYTWTVRRVSGVTVTRSGSLLNFTFVDPGDYFVNLSAIDTSGNRNSSTRPIRVNDIPVLDNSPPSTLTLPENMDFRLTITDADAGDSFNVTNVTPAGITVGTDTSTGRPRLTWAPTTYGPFTINFTLSDGFAWVNYSFNLTIRVSPTNNPPPVWDNVALGELRESITYTYDANAHDPLGDTVYYGLTVGPSGMSIDFVTGIVTWYHTLHVTSSDQVFDVHIFAWDGANYIWQNYTVRLRATPNVAPVIDAAGAWSTVTVEEGGNVTVTLGSHYHDDDDTLLDVTATTFDADKVSLVVVSLGGFPALRISGIAPGSATIRLRVADPSQANATRDIAVTVTPRTNGTPGGGESGIGGLIPLLGLAVAGAGIGGFLIVMRGRKRREEKAPSPATAVEAGAAPTLAPGAGTVVLTAESAAAAAAAASLVAAGPALEKKITYTIEGLFVIYKDGRLLYSKTDMGQAKFEDPELVSSMFTAVQSFIKDSFSAEGELNKMGYGDNQIIIERGRSVFTAAIVYGEPDQEFHDAMKAAIENVELSYAGLIEKWDGMMDTFADMDQKLAGVIALSAGITRREVQLATTKQEVLMLSELEFFQGFVRLKCGIKNNTPSVITKATVDIEYNEDVLRLARVEPAAYRTAGAKVLLGVLNPGEKSSVAYYFDPQICTESQIDGVCRYRDASGVLHTVAMKTRKAEVVCPLFFTKEHANTAMLKRLVEQELGEKDSKIFQIQKIPPYIKHKDVFDLIKSVVNAHDVQMVREFTKFNPFHGEAWFYGETKVKNYKIVIRATVIEETNAIEFFAASTNMKAITGLLAEFNHTLNSMVIEKYSDLKIAQIFDSETKAEIEKKSLMSNMSSAELEGAETEQGGGVASAPAPPEQPPSEAKPTAQDGLDIPEPEDHGKPGEGGG